MVIWHPGSGTWADMSECKIIDVPDYLAADAIEDWLKENHA